tara:strand:+ start:3285 stop:4061 length:777 start_codon:yes stop_codon:yes gene_type:complete
MEYLKIEHRDRVALLTINDPERRNVVSNELNEELVSTFDQLEKNDTTGAVVITGEGRAFCAGAILDDLLDAGELQKKGDEASLPHIYRGFLRVAHSTLPTVAAVNGAAVGAGMNMVLACDLVIAGTSARFDTRFLNIGLHPGGGHTWRLRNITNLQTAKAMVLFNQILDGEAAAKHGLVWECVSDDELIETAVNFASEAAAHPPELVAKTKETFSATSKTFDSISSVELEVGPQRWSMQQSAFVEMVGGLKKKITGDK